MGGPGPATSSRSRIGARFPEAAIPCACPKPAAWVRFPSPAPLSCQAEETPASSSRSFSREPRLDRAVFQSLHPVPRWLVSSDAGSAHVHNKFRVPPRNDEAGWTQLLRKVRPFNRAAATANLAKSNGQKIVWQLGGPVKTGQRRYPVLIPRSVAASWAHRAADLQTDGRGPVISAVSGY